MWWGRTSSSSRWAIRSRPGKAIRIGRCSSAPIYWPDRSKLLRDSSPRVRLARSPQHDARLRARVEREDQYNPKVLPRRYMDAESVFYKLSADFRPPSDKAGAKWLSRDCTPYRASGAVAGKSQLTAQFDQLSDLICRGGAAARLKCELVAMRQIESRRITKMWCPPQSRKRPVDVVLMSIGGNSRRGPGCSALAADAMTDSAADFLQIDLDQKRQSRSVRWRVSNTMSNGSSASRSDARNGHCIQRPQARSRPPA